LEKDLRIKLYTATKGRPEARAGSDSNNKLKKQARVLFGNAAIYFLQGRAGARATTHRLEAHNKADSGKLKRQPETAGIPLFSSIPQPALLQQLWSDGERAALRAGG